MRKQIPFDRLKVEHGTSRESLTVFVEETESFLGWVVRNDQDFGFLWQDAPELREEAREQLRYDVHRSAVSLRKAIPRIEKDKLEDHGLLGRARAFKVRVLKTISGLWEKAKREFSVREWFMQMVDAIDALLTSLVAAAGAGGALMEFKDALSALVKRK